MKGNHKSKGAPLKVGIEGKAGTPGSRKRRNRSKFSSTPGKIKADSCKATWRQRDWAKRSRSYKGADYLVICNQMNRKASGAQVNG